MPAMSDVKTRTKPAPTYDGDFYAWTGDQAARLREQKPKGIDWENVAEEIESLGRSERREIRSRMLVLLHHLLKWQFQPAGRSNSWRASIRGARRELARDVAESPSLKRYPAQVLREQYELARLEASGETGLPEMSFPETCPFTIDQVLDPVFYPEPTRG
jgi:hypothetical protein